MSEYTSLEASKRLAEAGFEITPPDAMWGIDPITKEVRLDTWYYATNDRRAYRYDTLLDWLMHKPLFSLRTHTVSVEARGVQMVGKKDHELRLFVTVMLGSGKTLKADAPTFSDALAEVVLKVLRVQS